MMLSVRARALYFIQNQLVELAKNCGNTLQDGLVNDSVFMELENKLEKILHETRAAYRPPPIKPMMSDFDFIKPVGSGAFGTVNLVRHKKSRQAFAMKHIELQEKRQRDEVLLERDILTFLDSSFVISMFCSFEPRKNHLCLVMEYVGGGDIGTLLRHFRHFPVDTSRFYIAELVLALEYIHSYGIIHRDLKPNNLLITTTGHIKVADFGLSKLGSVTTAACLTEEDCQRVAREFRDGEMFGTPSYTAPEVYLSTGYGKPIDWWATGIILYEFLFGFTPFSKANNDRDVRDVSYDSYDSYNVHVRDDRKHVHFRDDRKHVHFRDDRNDSYGVDVRDDRNDVHFRDDRNDSYGVDVRDDRNDVHFRDDRNDSYGVDVRDDRNDVHFRDDRNDSYGVDVRDDRNDSYGVDVRDDRDDRNDSYGVDVRDDRNDRNDRNDVNFRDDRNDSYGVDVRDDRNDRNDRNDVNFRDDRNDSYGVDVRDDRNDVHFRDDRNDSYGVDVRDDRDDRNDVNFRDDRNDSYGVDVRDDRDDRNDVHFRDDRNDSYGVDVRDDRNDVHFRDDRNDSYGVDVRDDRNDSYGVDVRDDRDDRNDVNFRDDRNDSYGVDVRDDRNDSNHSNHSDNMPVRDDRNDSYDSYDSYGSYDSYDSHGSYNMPVMTNYHFGISQRVIYDGIFWPPQSGCVLPLNGRKLIHRLLDKNCVTRLGTRGAHEVKEHPFFQDVDWSNLHNQPPPYVPGLENEEDTSCYQAGPSLLSDICLVDGDNQDGSPAAPADFCYVAFRFKEEYGSSLPLSEEELKMQAINGGCESLWSCGYSQCDSTPSPPSQHAPPVQMVPERECPSDALSQLVDPEPAVEADSGEDNDNRSVANPMMQQMKSMIKPLLWVGLHVALIMFTTMKKS